LLLQVGEAPNQFHVSILGAESGIFEIPTWNFKKAGRGAFVAIKGPVTNTSSGVLLHYRMEVL
jgi:hypothetical protein